MRVDGNQGGAPNYFPNSFGGPEPTPEGSNETDCYILCAYLMTITTNKCLEVILPVLNNTAVHANQNDNYEMFDGHTSCNRSTPPYTFETTPLASSPDQKKLPSSYISLLFLSLFYSWVARGPSIRWRHKTRNRTRRQLHTVRRFLQKRPQCSWEGKTHRQYCGKSFWYVSWMQLNAKNAPSTICMGNSLQRQAQTFVAISLDPLLFLVMMSTWDLIEHTLESCNITVIQTNCVSNLLLYYSAFSIVSDPSFPSICRRKGISSEESSSKLLRRWCSVRQDDSTETSKASRCKDKGSEEDNSRPP